MIGIGPDTTREPSLHQIVGRLAAHLRGAGPLSIGDAASLRRMDPRHPPAAFFKLEALAMEDQIGPSHGFEPSAETRWAAIVLGLAHLDDLHDGAPEHRLGRVLAEAGYPEVRFARLLAADAERLIDDVPTLARYLLAKRCKVDWTGAARLLLSAGHPASEEPARRQLARDYYRSLASSVSA